jgi:hypothetical protein
LSDGDHRNLYRHLNRSGVVFSGTLVYVSRCPHLMVDMRRTAPELTSPGPTRATLPADRAFVVQLRADVDFGRGLVSGRVEHMSSGAAAVFESVEELVRCMRDAIERRPDVRDAAGVAPERTDGETT